METRSQQDHEALTRREFARQADTFESPGWLFTATDILDWIAGATPVAPSDRVLDVAGGTGALGRHLSRGAAGCVVLDLVPEMLDAGAAAVAEEGRRDVLFLQGDAGALPFRADQFDVVVTRFALHHMTDPARTIAEMARVCRAGGRVTAIDMVADEGPAGEAHDRLERLRDPSHTSAPRHAELVAWVEAAGVRVDARSERDGAMPLRPWLAQAHADDAVVAEVEAALRAELDGGPATGLRPRLRDGWLAVVQRWALVGGVVG
jgi:SAM-dependent methyltransferase